MSVLLESKFPFSYAQVILAFHENGKCEFDECSFIRERIVSTHTDLRFHNLKSLPCARMLHRTDSGDVKCLLTIQKFDKLVSQELCHSIDQPAIQRLKK